jgi:drug/metabolite transporter (DMT)-like permease
MASWLRPAAGALPLSPRDRRLLFLASFLGNFLFSICMLFGVAHTSAVTAGVVLAGLPAAVALLSRVTLGERMSAKGWTGTACAVGGIAVLALARRASPQDGGVDAPWWGIALLMGALLCEASFVVIGKRLSAGLTPQRISALVNLWGLALFTPLGAWQLLHFDASKVDASHGLGLIGYALAASVVTVWLWMRGLQTVPAAKAGLMTIFLPIGAAAAGVLFMDEAFSLGQLAALGLALLGLLIGAWPERERELRRAQAG